MMNYQVTAENETFAYASTQEELRKALDGAISAGYSADSIRVYQEISFTYTPAVSTLVL
jgi:hypothetical protein